MAASFTGSIFAFSVVDAQARSIAFAFFTTGPGAFPVSQTPGYNATYVEGSAGWGAAQGLSGSSGSVTLTTLTASHAVGTYNFVMIPSTGGATGTRSLAGSFDVTY
jgi:hypothetical protein